MDIWFISAIYVWVCVWIWVFVCTCVCMYLYACVCLHMYCVVLRIGFMILCILDKCSAPGHTLAP